MHLRPTSKLGYLSFKSDFIDGLYCLDGDKLSSVIYHGCSVHFQEVFKSDFADGALLKHVIGKCYVMYVKEYFKLKPEVRLIKDCLKQSASNTNQLVVL